MRHYSNERVIKMTRARAEVMKRDWPNPAVSTKEVFSRVNALPGEPFVAVGSLYKAAEQVGLPRSRKKAMGKWLEAQQSDVAAERSASIERGAVPAAAPAPDGERGAVYWVELVNQSGFVVRSWQARFTSPPEVELRIRPVVRKG